MYVLSILDTSGAKLWTEEYRTVKSLRKRAPDAVCELDDRYAAYVDELVMVPAYRGFPKQAKEVGVANAKINILC